MANQEVHFLYSKKEYHHAKLACDIYDALVANNARVIDQYQGSHCMVTGIQKGILLMDEVPIEIITTDQGLAVHLQSTVREVDSIKTIIRQEAEKNKKT